MADDLLHAALRYADLGYAVFPCARGRKHPATPHGFQDASTDPEQLERWWAAQPHANVALATAGLLVVDIDRADNPWLKDDLARWGELAAAPQARTPRGGRHFYFRAPASLDLICTQGVLAPHVDTRAGGGYVLLPPSQVGGQPYAWAAGAELDLPLDRLPEPPAWLLDALQPAASAPRAALPANAIPEGQRNAALARLGGGMRRMGMSEPEIAAALAQANRDRCHPPLPDREVARIAQSVARYEPDQVATALAEDHWSQTVASAAAAAAPTDDPGPLLEDLLRIPGFVDEVADYTMRTAPYPERVLAFCGALALQAFLAGRKVRDAGGSRSNLYLLGLANTGSGKDYPRQVNQRILLEAGLAGALGESFASGEGLEDRLLGQPAMLFQTDEIDGLIAKINLGKDARYEGIMNTLLKMFTSAAALYPMRVKAGKEGAIIDQPSVTIYGTAIPRNYYEALSLKMLTNGFFARLVIVEAGKRGTGQDGDGSPPPPGVLAAARWWAEFRPGRVGNMNQYHPEPRLVEATPEARALQAAFREMADDEYARAEGEGNEPGMALWSRANEKARRLALVHACSANREAPAIDRAAAEWSCRFVEHLTRRMLFMAAGHVSENDFDARCKKLVATLREWQAKQGDAWMPFWRIGRRHPWSVREHDEVRGALMGQELIEYGFQTTGGRPQRLYRLKPGAAEATMATGTEAAA